MKTVFFLWFLGLFLVMFFAYIAISFINIEVNPFIWSIDARIVLSIVWFVYICFSWPIVEEIKKQINKNENA